MEESCLVDVDEKDGVVDLDQIWRDEYFKVRIRISSIVYNERENVYYQYIKQRKLSVEKRRVSLRYSH
jgi:hypothetical protein